MRFETTDNSDHPEAKTLSFGLLMILVSVFATVDDDSQNGMLKPTVHVQF